MRASSRLILQLCLAMTVLCGHYGNADDVSLDHEVCSHPISFGVVAIKERPFQKSREKRMPTLCRVHRPSPSRSLQNTKPRNQDTTPANHHGLDDEELEEFDMAKLLDVLIKTRGRSAAPRAPAASAHPSYSAVPAHPRLILPLFAQLRSRGLHRLLLSCPAAPGCPLR